ncbi:MAG: hypothetical protein ACLFTG_05810 [Alphaproteobacteria bacterium]
MGVGDGCCADPCRERRGGERSARCGLGLGDPPLSVEDAEIDDLFAPGTYRRLGKTLGDNGGQTRSDEPSEADLAAPRVLVMAGSVINGGVLGGTGSRSPAPATSINALR